MTHEPSDLIELHERVQHGDESALLELFARHRDRLKPAGAEIAGRVEGQPTGPTHLLDEPAGRRGDYRLLREIARGGMGVVYEAIQESLGRPLLSLTSGAAPVFSRDGRIVVSLDDQLMTYRVDPAFEYRSLVHVSSETLGYARVAIHRDGRILAAGTQKGVVLWDLARGAQLAFLPIGSAQHVMFEASGALVTSGTIGVWRWSIQLDPDRGATRIGPPSQLPLPVGGRGIDADRTRRIVAKANHDSVHVVAPGRVSQVGPLDDVRSVAVCPDGQWLVTGSHHRGAQVWRIGDAVPVVDLPIDLLPGHGASPAGTPRGRPLLLRTRRALARGTE
jgi:hypothetical protein